MELDVTHLMERREDMQYYSGSQFELGADAGRSTWENAMDVFDPDTYDNWADWKARGGFLVSPTDKAALQEVRNYFKEFGAWSEEEIAEWTPQELNAILLQDIAATIREAEDCLDDPEEYRRQCEAGQISGRLFQCDIEGDEDFGRWFFYVGI